MDRSNLPVSCNLTGPEFQLRRSAVLSNVGDGIREVKELDSGYACCFPTEIKWIAKLAELITSEHTCCPFLRFSLIVEPGDGPILLELTGPEGTKEFLNSLFSS